MIAVGPGTPNKKGDIIPTTVKPGDRVLLPGWGGSSIKVGEDVCDKRRFTSHHHLTYIFKGILSFQGFGDPCEDQGVVSSYCYRKLLASKLYLILSSHYSLLASAPARVCLTTRCYLIFPDNGAVNGVILDN